MSGSMGTIYSRLIPSVHHADPALVINHWHECERAELRSRGLSPDEWSVVWVLDLIKVERLARGIVPGTEGEVTRFHAHMLGVSWLRLLSEAGFSFAWSPGAIRRAELDCIHGREDAEAMR